MLCLQVPHHNANPLPRMVTRQHQQQRSVAFSFSSFPHVLHFPCRPHIPNFHGMETCHHQQRQYVACFYFIFSLFFHISHPLCRPHIPPSPHATVALATAVVTLWQW